CLPPSRPEPSACFGRDLTDAKSYVPLGGGGAEKRAALGRRESPPEAYAAYAEDGRRPRTTRCEAYRPRRIKADPERPRRRPPPAGGAAAPGPPARPRPACSPPAPGAGRRRC